MNKNKKKLDVYLIINGDFLENINITIEYIRKNLINIDKINVVTDIKKIKFKINADLIIDENDLEIDKKEIIKWFKDNSKNEKRVNWYFQQFIKLSIYKKAITEYYVVWDGDTIPLKKIELIKLIEEENNILIRPSREHHKPYFNTNQKLIGLEKLKNYSFINEYAVINKKICERLLDEISEKSNLKWYLFILESINKKDIEYSGFSEYELMGNYQVAQGIKYKTFEGKSLRIASSYFGEKANKKTLDFLKRYYTFVSYEKWGIRNKKVNYLLNNFPYLAVITEEVLIVLRKTKKCFKRN